MNIFKSAAAYEDWLRAQLDDVVEKDIAVKHKKMAGDPFQFLRATYWRWAETIYGVCRDLKDAPHVLAVGDIHVENFGTWRDAEGRLVWGVNDFDEAAKMPYVLDIVRLAASAVLAKVPGITQRGDLRQHRGGLCEGPESAGALRARPRSQMAARYRRGERQGPQEILGEVRSRADRRGEAGQGRSGRAGRNCAAATARRSSARARSRSRAGVLFARGRYRQPRTAAVLRRRPVAGRA